MADLAALKIKTDIDLEGGDIHSLDPVYDAYDYIAEPGERKSSILAEKKEAQSHGIRFVNIPLNAYEQVTPAEALRIDRILRIMHNPKNQPVYVHCEHGKDRTGLIMALYAVKYLHESPAQAHAEMVADGHSGSVDQLVTHQMDVYFWQIAPAYAKDNP
jgi:protein tyrosine/serine phosphatase